ncbi:hypothetical protein [Methanobrevibacter filiformis]|uniref:Uncharacterized protein n=1 Tax=Methanobrevibacter filiformis TaxID=55758 RepID=A0A165YYH9_9EURY|nr:hypothetical protein [Methanobrevibacter filiformis]KZX10031.1 hypothetical protein MBFIL_19260 [Methanobrevibacter filiformis]
MGLFDSIDEMMAEDFERFNDFKDVSRIDELLDLFKGLRRNKEYKKMSLLANKDMGKSTNKWRFDESKIPFINAAKKGFGFSLPIHLPPLTKFIDYDFFKAFYSIIQVSYIYRSGEALDDKEYRSIILGDIGPQITYFVEDFDKSYEMPIHSKNFFKRLKNVYYADKRAKRLEHIIYSRLFVTITQELDSVILFDRTVGACAMYLMACNALKNNRDIVTCEDVVVAYLTTFKILSMDIRKYVPLLD